VEVRDETASPASGQQQKGGTATGTFIVECYWPGITEGQVREILDRLGLARRPSSQTKVQPLGSLLVPSDRMVIFLFEGTSSAAIREAATLAEVPFDRIVEFRHIMAGGSGA